MNQLPVQGVKINRCLKEGKGNGRLGHMKEDRIAWMGDGDAASDASRAEFFPSVQDFKQVFAVHLFWKAEFIDEPC